MIKLQTVECAECGTVRNKIAPVNRHAVLGEDILAEMDRTNVCPYCDHTEVHPLEESVA